MLYIILCPTGPYFRNDGKGPSTKAISLLSVSEHVRAWPGGTGGYKLGLNYAPGFMPQALAKEKGYDQVLWLLPHDGEKKITEAGAMNFFAVVKRDDGGEYLLFIYVRRMPSAFFTDIDVVTPALDGTILPGVTRDSCLSLIRAHSSPSSPFVLPGLSSSIRMHTVERTVVMSEIEQWAKEERLLEVFCVGTAVTVAAVGKIGLDCTSQNKGIDGEVVLPRREGSVSNGLLEALGAIQTDRMQFEDWCVPCV